MLRKKIKIVKTSHIRQKNIRVHGQNITVYFSKMWSCSKNKLKKNKNRAELQEHLNNKIKSLQKKMVSHKKVFFSISHNQFYGGYAICKTRPVGLDIESSDREISHRAYLRFTDDSERSFNISPLFIWIIKEASWKTLRGYKQPRTVTEIKIIKFKKNNFSFSLKNTKMFKTVGLGTICDWQGQLFSIALKNSL